MALRAFRNLLSRNCLTQHKSCSQTLMTSPINYEKVQEDLKHNPYFDKYADKIEELKKCKPGEYFSKLKEIEGNKKKLKKAAENAESGPNKLTSKKSLGDIMKLELITDKPSEVVAQIWHDFHRRLQNCISNVISADIYSIMDSNSKDYPTFVVPIPRNDGYEFIMVYYSQNVAHFTPLERYQKECENASECLQIRYYPELASSKNIVLMRGFYDPSVVSSLEANCLSSSLQLYYGDPSGKRSHLLHLFTNEPNNFKHMDLIADFESYSSPS